MSLGLDCPLDHVASVDSSCEMIRELETDPDVVFVTLSPDVDRAVETIEQIRRRCGLRVCAVGAAKDPHEILRVVRAGPEDYIDQDGDLDAQIGDLISRLKAIDRSQSQHGAVMTIVSPSGGSGCTTLAANLAVAQARTHGQSLICDLDMRSGALAPMFNLKPTHSIVDLCGNLRNLDEQMLERSLLKHDSGVHVLAAPQRYSDVQPITSEAAETIVEIAATVFPCVIADLEDFFHREQFRILQMSDAILLVFRLEFNALRNVRRTIEYLEQNGILKERISLVANEFGRPRELSQQQAEDALQNDIAFFVPYEPKVVLPAVNRGVPVLLDARRSKYSRAIQQISEAVTWNAPV